MREQPHICDKHDECFIPSLFHSMAGLREATDQLRATLTTGPSAWSYWQSVIITVLVIEAFALLVAILP